MLMFEWSLVSFGILLGAFSGAMVAKIPALELTSKAARNLIIAFSLAGGVAGLLTVYAL